MSKSIHHNQLVSARRACLYLTGYAVGEERSLLLPPDETLREQIAYLLDQFRRLDKAATKARAGHIKGGKSVAGLPRNRKLAGKAEAIARLLANGASQRQIAIALEVSPSALSRSAVMGEAKKIVEENERKILT